MRRFLLAAFGVFAIAGVASAQQPQYPAPPAQLPRISPAAAVTIPVIPASGATVIKGNGGCTNCGPTQSRGFTMSSVTGGNCQLGAACQSGCGSLKSNLAFHFGSCSNFFSPCGPGRERCPTLPFAAPWGQGYGCPRTTYDSHHNH